MGKVVHKPPKGIQTREPFLNDMRGRDATQYGTEELEFQHNFACFALVLCTVDPCIMKGYFALLHDAHVNEKLLNPNGSVDRATRGLIFRAARASAFIFMRSPSPPFISHFPTFVLSYYYYNNIMLTCLTSQLFMSAVFLYTLNKFSVYVYLKTNDCRNFPVTKW